MSRALIAAARCADWEMVLLLVDWSANLNEKDEYDATPLIYAVEAGQAVVVRRLLDNGASWEGQSPMGWGSVLHSAVRQDNEDILRLLLDRDVPLNLEDAQGSTALDIAEGRHPLMAQMLRDEPLRRCLVITEKEKARQERRQKALHKATALTRNLPYKKSPFKLKGVKI